ncbi:MAG: hypothetical protein LUC26_03420 [Prevotella sp.]|nr:hypothetical protein [Prevotella sp.]
MMPRFRLPLTSGEATAYLLGAVKAEVAYRHRTFVHTPQLDEQLQKMAAWLTDNNQKFGMLLCGGCGTGKTTFIKAFRQLLNSYSIINPLTKERYGMRIINANDAVNLYKADAKKWRELAGTEMLAVDDLGTEPAELVDYGNIAYPVIDLLARRYDEQLFTILSSNLAPPEIGARYGERIADRMREMMERITFANSSYRSI